MNDLLEPKKEVHEKTVDELQQSERIIELLRLEKRISDGRSAEAGTTQADYERLIKIKACIWR